MDNVGTQAIDPPRYGNCPTIRRRPSRRRVGHRFKIFQSAIGTKFPAHSVQGGGPANTDVISGQVHMQFTSIFGATGLIVGARCRPLAIPNDVRSPALPDVPTMAEEGIDGAATGSWDPKRFTRLVETLGIHAG